jgi:hypothetical protein
MLEASDEMIVILKHRVSTGSGSDRVS